MQYLAPSYLQQLPQSDTLINENLMRLVVNYFAPKLHTGYLS